MSQNIGKILGFKQQVREMIRQYGYKRCIRKSRERLIKAEKRLEKARTERIRIENKERISVFDVIIALIKR